MNDKGLLPDKELLAGLTLGLWCRTRPFPVMFCEVAQHHNKRGFLPVVVVFRPGYIPYPGRQNAGRALFYPTDGTVARDLSEKPAR